MPLDEILDAYTRALSSAGPGRDVQIVRLGDSFVYNVSCFVSDWVPADLAGAVEQGRRTAVILYSDMLTSGFPLPLIPKQDRIKYGVPQKTNVISSVEERWYGDTLIAYECKIDGA